MKRVNVAALKEFTVEILVKCMVSRRDAETTAEALVSTDSWGVFTHGTKSLYGYARRLRGRGINPLGSPNIRNEGPAWALVDGDASLGMVTGVYSMKLAISKAADSGIGFVVARNSCHFGAAGYYVSLAAAADKIGMAVSNDIPSVAAPGSCGPVLGSNPFAFGAAAEKEPAFVLDMSTAVVAGGKIYIAANQGRSVPAEWLVDDKGLPTSNAKLYPLKASLAPMSGHKGFGLAMMIEVLSGVLSGASVREEIGSWMEDSPEEKTDHSHAFLAIDPSIIGGDGRFPARMDKLIRGIRASPPAQGVDRIRIPGEIEQDKRQEALNDGIELPSDVVEKLVIAAKEAGCALPPFLC